MELTNEINIKDAIILAGGRGSRLKNEKHNHSKPMTPILGKPLITFTIDAMLSYGISNIVIVYSQASSDLLNLSRYSDTYNKVVKLVEDTYLMGKLTGFICTDGLVKTPFICSYGDVVVLNPAFSDMLRRGGLQTDKKPDLIIQTVENPSIPIDGEFEKRLLINNSGQVVRWKKDGYVDIFIPNDCHARAGGMFTLWLKEPFAMMRNYISCGNKSYSSFMEHFVPLHQVYAMPIKDIWDIDIHETIIKTEEILQERYGT